MDLPQAPRRREDEPRPIHFTYVETPNGTKWPAWIAGPTKWFFCHPSRKTKPCAEKITSGEVLCPYCGRGLVPVVKGFTPLYRGEDTKAVCVVVPEEWRDEMDKLQFHTRVLVGREKSSGSPVWIQRTLNQEPFYQTTLAERKRPANLTLSLLRMWKDEALTEWCRRTSTLTASEAQKLDTPTSRTLKGIATALEHQAGASEGNAERAKKSAATVRNMLEGIGKPPPNGKH